MEEEKAPEKEELSIGEVKERIKNKKSHLLQDTEKDYQPILEKVSNIRKKMESLNKDLENAEPEEEVHPNIYKSANEGRRLLINKVDRAVEKLEVPSDPTWNDLLGFNESLLDAVNLLENAKFSHGEQVAALFENELSRMSRLVRSLSSVSNELNDSLRKVKSKSEDLEDIKNKIENRENLMSKRDHLEEKIDILRNKKEEMEYEIEKEREKLLSLKKSDRFKELDDIKGEIDELSHKKEKIRKEIDSNISELARPLRKMSKMIERDEHMVSSEVLEAIDLYQENPVQAALEEEEGLPKLKAMLRELEGVLEDKMKLSNREREKRLEEVRYMIESEKVKRLREDYLRAVKEVENLKKEIDDSPLLEKKERLETSIKNKKLEIEEFEEKITKKEEELKDVNEQIGERSRDILEKVDSVLGVRVEDLDY